MQNSPNTVKQTTTTQSEISIIQSLLGLPTVTPNVTTNDYALEHFLESVMDEVQTNKHAIQTHDRVILYTTLLSLVHSFQNPSKQSIWRDTIIDFFSSK